LDPHSHFNFHHHPDPDENVHAYDHLYPNQDPYPDGDTALFR
jgi:hypothetical protein